jgi:hypothetical protein
MSYINYLNTFWQLRQDEFIAPTEADLYFALLQIANLTKWQDEFTASLGRLESMTDMSRHTIIKARNRLVELGLIAFEQGTKGRGKNATYALLKGAEKSAIKCANKKCNIAPFNNEKGAEKGADLHLLDKEKKESFPPNPLYKEKKENIKRKKDDSIGACACERDAIEELKNQFMDSWTKEKTMMLLRIHDESQYISLLDEVLDEMAIMYGSRTFDVTNDTRQHVTNWIRKKKQIYDNSKSQRQDFRRTTPIAAEESESYTDSF